MKCSMPYTYGVYQRPPVSIEQVEPVGNALSFNTTRRPFFLAEGGIDPRQTLCYKGFHSRARNHGVLRGKKLKIDAMCPA